jgi:hypothetical protein
MKRIALACGLALLFAAACGHSGHSDAASAPKPKPKASLAATPSPSPSPSAKPRKHHKAKHRPRPHLAWWQPRNVGPNHGAEWQWELDHSLNLSSAADTGNRAVNAVGRVAPGPTVYDIDGIDNSAATVAALHSRSDRAICYIEIGAAGNYYPTSYYAQLKAAGDLGSNVSGYPEQYININAPSAVSIIESMIRQQCAAKGFDGVEPDIDDSYTDSTGFHITEQDNIRYDRTLGAYTHSLGLAWGQKNGDNDPAFSASLEPTTDFLLDEECNFYHTCGIVATPYVRAGKLVLNAEYTDDWGSNTAQDLAKFCAADAAAGIDGTLFTTDLTGQRNPCR